MRNSFTLALALAGSLSVTAQSITSVDITPANPTACDLLEVEFNGVMPQNAELLGFVPSPGPDTLKIVLNAAGGGGGNGGFSQSVFLGPFPEGSLVVYVLFVLNGDTVDTDTQTLNITPGVNPNAGEPGELLSICTGGPPVVLFDLLGGDPDTGGQWLDPNAQPVEDGLFIPGQSPEGYYEYRFDVFEPCIDAFQYVLITYEPGSSSAGLNNTVPTCEGYGSPVDLLDTLAGTPDPGGTWTFNGTAHSSVFDPLTDACGVYTYSVPGQGACPPAVATVTVQCVQLPNAGNPNVALLNLCYNDSIQLLQTNITGEQTTGIWLGPLGFQIGFYNDSLNPSLNGSGIYSYVVSNPICPTAADTSSIEIVLWGDPDVGCTIGLAETGGNVARFEVVPNPAQDQVTIEVELTRSGPSQFLEVVDIDGKVVLSQGLNFNGLLARQTLPVGDLARGAYLVRIGSTEGRSVRRLMLR